MLEPEAAFATMTDMVGSKAPAVAWGPPSPTPNYYNAHTTSLCGSQIDLAEATVVDCLRSVTQECPEEVAFFGQWVDKGVPDRIAAALSGACVVGVWGLGCCSHLTPLRMALYSAPHRAFRSSQLPGGSRAGYSRSWVSGGWLGVLATGWVPLTLGVVGLLQVEDDGLSTEQEK